MLVFKEILMFDPMERVVCLMLASIWQNSRHCFTELLAPSGEEDISEEALAEVHFHIFI